ncbi:SiaB family protein kinase [Paraburkholderia sp.]|uniref:SiaB family protein kinase n=1 Tax=Paraburkholderia sp. TaxID=1926495 RepID=UPI003D6F5632
MDFRTFESFSDAAGEAGLVYYYAGHFDEEVRRALSANLKSRLEMENVGSPAKRKLFSTFMEMAQNVLHYGGCVETQDNEERPGAIAVGRDAASYWIVCSNLVPVEHVSRIAGKLDQLKQMSLDEIKTAYREQLANDDHAETDTVSKGAGLGLLTIARDSIQPVEYAFRNDEASDGRFARFTIKAFV